MMTRFKYYPGSYIYLSKFCYMLFCIVTFTTITPYHTNLFINLYHIRCLSQSDSFLSYLHKHKYYYQPCSYTKKKDCILIDSTIFSHHTIRDCIEKIIHTHCLEPLVDLLQEIKRSPYLHDHECIREVCLLIFTIQKHIILNEYEKQPTSIKTITLETILEISDKINQLPIAEVLNAIDLLVTEIPPFLEKYEFYSKKNWKEWLKKYWWVPPVFTVWFSLKVLLRLQKSHYYFPSYLSPRPTIPLSPIITNDSTLEEIIILEKKTKSKQLKNC